MFRGAILQTAAELLIVEDALVPAEFSVLLSGETEERPRRVTELYRQGLATVVLVCHKRKTEAQRARRLPSHTEILVATLELYGVLRSAIEVPGGTPSVTSTYEEALTVKRYLDDRRADGPIALVTSAMDLRTCVRGLPPHTAGLDGAVRGVRRDELVAPRGRPDRRQQRVRQARLLSLQLLDGASPHAPRCARLAVSRKT